MKYRVNFVTEEGKTVHTTYVDARNKTEACRKIEQDQEVKKALQKVLKGKAGELDFYMDPVNTLN